VFLTLEPIYAGFAFLCRDYMRRVAIRFGGGSEVVVSLREDASESVRHLLSSVPFKSVANTWGDEVYFEVPFHADLEIGAREEMEIGDVAFWPDGDAMAIFFGRTPASTGPRPRAYSPCNPLGRVEGDLSLLRGVKPGTSLRVLAL